MARLPVFAAEGAWATGRNLRSVAYAATSGQTGVVTPDSMKVTSNGAGVSIAPGAAVAATRYVASPAFNSYVMSADSAETLAIPATGSGGGATRFIIARADDPEYGGQGDPEGIFWRYEQVGSITNLAYPFVPLAQINQPASTTTITNAMITDLRQIATPRRRRDTTDKLVTGSQDLTSSTFVDFPNAGTIAVFVPDWATKAIVRCDLLELMVRNANSDGNMTLMLGNQPAYSSERRYDVLYGGATERIDQTIVSGFTITDAMRGTNQNLRVRARRIGGSGVLRADAFTQVVWDVEFIEAPA